jgi:hypothetical protein
MQYSAIRDTREKRDGITSGEREAEVVEKAVE